MIIMRYIPKVGRGGLSGLGEPERPMVPGQNPDDLMMTMMMMMMMTMMMMMMTMMLFSLRCPHMFHELIKHTTHLSSIA
jgi:hypothetical protein